MTITIPPRARPQLPLVDAKMLDWHHPNANERGYVTVQDAPEWWYDIFEDCEVCDEPVVDINSGITVVRCEAEDYDDYEPGQFINTYWTVVIDPTKNTVTFAARDGSQVYKVVDFDQFDASVVDADTTRLVRVLNRYVRYVPQAGSPNQPDTPSLQDMYPNHPSFTEGGEI